MSSIQHIHLAAGPTDLRKSIDGFSLIVSQSFDLDPFSKSLFIFCNKKKDKIKILVWDYNGFWLHYKRLEKGKFKFPKADQSGVISIEERQFRWLMEGLRIDQKSAHKEVYERIIG